MCIRDSKRTVWNARCIKSYSRMPLWVTGYNFLQNDIHLFGWEFFFAVDAAVHLFLRICQLKYVRKLLLNRCDASWVFTADDVCHLFRQCKIFLFNNFSVADNVDSCLLYTSIYADSQADIKDLWGNRLLSSDECHASWHEAQSKSWYACGKSSGLWKNKL